MTQPPPPYGGYPHQPPTPPPTPGSTPGSKPRPSGWWFVVGGVLVGAAAIAGVVLFVWIFVSLFQTDVEVPLDPGPNRIATRLYADDRALFAEGPTLGLRRPGDPVPPAGAGRLVVIAVGVDQYADPQLNLRFAVADARTVTETLRAAGMVSMQNRNWVEAEKRLRRALELCRQALPAGDIVLRRCIASPTQLAWLL